MKLLKVFQLSGAAMFLAGCVSFPLKADSEKNGISLLELAKTGTTQQIAEAMKAGAIVRAFDDERNSPLFMAAKYNPDPKVAVLLLKAGSYLYFGDDELPLSEVAKEFNNEDVAAVLAFAENDLRAFLAACRTGTIEEVRAAGKDWGFVNQWDEAWMSPLMYAARDNADPEVTRTLLEAGAFVYDFNQGGHSPLDLAKANNPNPEVARLLESAQDRLQDLFLLCRSGTPEQITHEVLSRNFVEQLNQEKLTPLAYSVKYGADPGVIRRLLSGGSDVNAKDQDFQTPLIWAMLANASPEVVGDLLNAGASVTPSPYDPKAPIFFAAEHNSHPEVVTLLARAGSALNEQLGQDPVTPLTIAIRHNSLGVIEAFLKAGSSVYGTGELTRTALHHAAKENPDPEVTKLLLRAGARISDRDAYGFTPLMLAARENNVAVVKVLLSEGALVNDESTDGETPLWMAAANSIEIVSLLVGLGAEVKVRSKWGWTPLDIAASRNQDPAVIDLFLKYGYEPEEIDQAFAYAVYENRNPEVARMLIEAGATPFQKGPSGMSVLMLATKNKNPDMLALFINLGAKLDEQDAEGHTALMYAAANSTDPKALSLLLQAGANPLIKNKEGRTAWDYAQQNEAIKDSEPYRVLGQF